MTKQPETIADQLIGELRVYSRTNEIPAQFTVAKFKRDANKLKSTSAAQAAMIHGMIACLERDIETCKKQHELSIRLHGEPDFYLNYYCSLLLLGRIHDGYCCLTEGLSKFPFSTDLIKAAIEAAMLLGFYGKVIEYYESLQSLQPIAHDQEIEKIADDAKQALSIDVPQETLDKLSYVVESIGIKHAAKLQSISLSSNDDVLFQWIKTSADVDTTVAMNFELCEALAETDINLNKVSVAFRAS